MQHQCDTFQQCIPSAPPDFSGMSLACAAREHVIGWYSTGPRLREADLSIQQLMTNYCSNPVLVICEVEVSSSTLGTSPHSCMHLMLGRPVSGVVMGAEHGLQGHVQLSSTLGLLARRRKRCRCYCCRRCTCTPASPPVAAAAAGTLEVRNGHFCAAGCTKYRRR